MKKQVYKVGQTVKVVGSNPWLDIGSSGRIKAISKAKSETLVRLLPQETLVRLLPQETLVRLLPQETLVRLLPQETLVRLKSKDLIVSEQT